MRASTFPLVDRIMDGRLGETLLGWQAENVALAEMVHRLRSEHDIKVSVETVRRWLIQLNEAPVAEGTTRGAA